MNSNNAVDECEDWRERITRALKDLRGDTSKTVARMHCDESEDDEPAPSVRF